MADCTCSTCPTHGEQPMQRGYRLVKNEAGDYVIADPVSDVERAEIAASLAWLNPYHYTYGAVQQ